MPPVAGGRELPMERKKTSPSSGPRVRVAVASSQHSGLGGAFTAAHKEVYVMLTDVNSVHLCLSARLETSSRVQSLEMNRRQRKRGQLVRENDL